jgi:hypothetical protein
VVDQPQKGVLSGTGANRQYVPNRNYSGTDSFTFKVNDGTLESAVVMVTLTIQEVNDAPMALGDSVTGTEDQPVSIVLRGSDMEFSPLTFTVVAAPTKGVLSGTAPNLTYTPNANVTGDDAFTFKVNDGALDSAVATVSIRISPVVTTSGRLRGQVQYYAAAGGFVRGVKLTMSEGATGSIVSGDDGSYELEAPEGAAVALTPSLGTDAPIANGVTTADITLIRRHVLGITPLDSPYKVMAGDVNGSESVTTADITLIRRLILGTATNFTAGLWRFVPSDEVIGDPLKPWTAPRMRRYASLAAGTLSGQDFKAIKLGDVNGSWKAPAAAPSSSVPRRRPTGRLVVGKVGAAAGGALDIPVSLEGLERLGSVQLTLSWDPSRASFEGIRGVALGELRAWSVGLNRIQEGLVTVSWDDPSGGGIRLRDGAELLRMTLKARTASVTGGLVRLVESPTPVEVSDQGEVMAVTVEPGWYEIGTEGGTATSSIGLRSLGRAADGGVQLEVRAPRGVRLGLETSATLGLWEEVQTVTGEGTDQPILLKPALPSGANSAFWRLNIK